MGMLEDDLDAGMREQIYCDNCHYRIELCQCNFGPNSHDSLRAANAARQKEWDVGNQINLAYRGNELAGEVGEACNVIKKLERERMGIAGSRATTEQLAEELADVVICADLAAMSAGIDLDAAIRAKFNATSKKVGLVTKMKVNG